MGKKSKRQTAKQKPKHTNKDPTSASASKTKQPNKKTTNTLYAIYKYSTQEVIDWGTTTYQKHKSKRLPHAATLSALIFKCLGSLVEMGISMPHPILNHLRTAIHYRTSVGDYYKAIPTASEQDHAKHQWLISQLIRLEREFSKLSRRQANEDDTTGNMDHEEEKSFGFALLSLSDDEEESDQEKHLDEHLRPVTRKPQTQTPTTEELEAEERIFAISLILTEIAQVRVDLQQLWKEWAISSSQSRNAADAGAELLAATACTEYTVAALTKFITQSSMEFPTFATLDLSTLGESSLSNQDVPLDLQVGECVTIRRLEKRPELNGRHGRVTTIVEERFGVQLFPDTGSGQEYDDIYYSKESKPSVLSIKKENLVRSDNSFVRLAQIEQALQNFPFDTCPAPPERIYDAPDSPEILVANMTFAKHIGKFNSAIQNHDFLGLLKLTVKYVMPIWVSFTHYYPDAGAADVVLVAFLREFAKTRKVKFHLAVAILVAIDGALVASGDTQDCAAKARDVYVETLRETYVGSTYTKAIHLLQQRNLKADGLYSHFEFARHYQTEFSTMSVFFPWLSGEMLQSGLRMHLVCSSGLPYSFCQEYTTVLHLYWMLRSEGYIGRLPEIEKSLIGMYRQKVWFRGGIPTKGSEAYLKSWQLAIGAVNLQGARLLGGQALARSGTTRAAAKDLEMTGLHVTEISRLQEMLQWKTMPIMDRVACFQEIQRVAKDEYHSVFTAPLMITAVKLSHLYNKLGATFIGTARSAGARMAEGFSTMTREMYDTSIVCFWGLSLADDRALNMQEKEIGLSLLAKSFKDIFREDLTGTSVEEPSLAFSPNDHAVDASLWGEKGAKQLQHLHVPL